MKKKKRRRRHSHAGFWSIIILILAASVFYLILHRDGNFSETASYAPAETASAQEAVSGDSADQNTYYMAQLNDTQLHLYEEMLVGARNHENTVSVSGKEEDVLTAWMALSNDHPEIFWHMTSYRTNSLREVSSITLDYEAPMDSESQQIEAIADGVIASLPAGSSEYDKAMEILRWIVDNTEPDDRDAIPEAQMKRMQDIRSVFLDHKSVCSGYAASFEYLLQKAGITCTVVTGRATSQGKTENHAWNLIRLNGNWYWSDPMWADPVVSSASSADNFRPGYLCLTDEEIFRTHEIDATAGMKDASASLAGRFTFPSCTDLSLNYYVLNGGEFTSYDLNAVQSYITGKTSSLPAVIDMQFPTYDGMNQAYEDLTADNFSSLDEAVRKAAGSIGTRSYTISYDPSLYSIHIIAS